jgi:hypothetical protein
MNRIGLLIIITLFTSTLFAQSIGEWTTHTSLRTVNDVTVNNEGEIWAATTGGILSGKSGNDINYYTTKEGLSRLDGTSIVYDGLKNQIIVGYIDGILDVIDLDEDQVIKLSDIERNQNFTSKGINDFHINENHLIVATDFGIVIYNLNNLFVEDSYIQIGDLTRGIPVGDIFVESDSLYVVTSEGIGVGNLNDELSINTNWKTFNISNSPVNGELKTVGKSNGILYVSTVDENYVKTENGWSLFTGFGSSEIEEYINDEGEFVAHSQNSIFFYDEDENTFDNISPPGMNLTIQAIKIRNGETYIATINNGVGIINNEFSDIEFIETGGPYQNYFKDLKFDEDILIAASTNESARNPDIDNPKGYYIYNGENWINFNQNTNKTIDSVNYQQAFTTAITNDYYYFGSWGRGVARHHKQDSTVKIFDETNSTLRGWVDDNELFPVISGIEKDSNDEVWLVSRFGDTPLYYQVPGDEDWIPLPKANSVLNSDEYVGLFIDSFDQKWITLENTASAGNGLVVVDTGNDPANTSDDTSVKLTTENNQGNLPDNKVNALIQDREGEVWIGTGRGIARFIFPELIIDGGPQEREAQWLINEDTSATSRFLLRDVNVSAMAVNSANEKWIGSVNQGIWVLNAEGSRIIKRFTQENSPLFSNSIESIAINEITGEVYIATDIGLISYQDTPKAPVMEMDELKVFPNPFSYGKNSRIIIEGLVDETKIRIVGVDGTVAQEIEARGGRVEWNGLDYNGNQLGSGVYFVIAYKDENRQTGMGKVVIVR